MYQINDYQPVRRPIEMTKARGAHCTCLLYVEAALREERFPFLGEEWGEEGGEDREEGGEADAEEGKESGETERLLVGLLLGEPRGEE